MLPPLTNDELVNRELTSFKSTLATTFPASEPPGVPCVSTDEQALELRLLTDTLPKGNFFFVVDYQTGQISHAHGLKQWLGWDDAGFQLAHYFQIILPSHLPSLTIMAANALRIIHASNIPMGFMSNKLVVQIPLQHADGTYWLCKRTVSPWQYASNRRVLSLINEYTLVKPYEGEPLSPHVIAANGLRSEALETLLRTYNFDSVQTAQTRPFTIAELRIARKLAYNPGVSVRELGEAFKSSARTVETHLRHIRIKATEHFMIPFATSLEAARYIRGQGLV
jgi:DNA-binding CsgD family transcriptional regulator